MEIIADHIGKGKCEECEAYRDLYKVGLEEICFKCLENREEDFFN